MNPWLLALMGVVNFAVAYGYLRNHHLGMAITFASYGTACAGFIIDSFERAT